MSIKVGARSLICTPCSERTSPALCRGPLDLWAHTKQPKSNPCEPFLPGSAGPGTATGAWEIPTTFPQHPRRFTLHWQLEPEISSPQKARYLLGGWRSSTNTDNALVLLSLQFFMCLSSTLRDAYGHGSSRCFFWLQI